MNIFFLDHSPALAAQYHYDSHVVKMILETAQLLSTAWHVVCPGAIELIAINSGQEVPSLGGKRIYSKTHENHPCALWVRDNQCNYQWALELGYALCDELKYRYGTDHLSRPVLDTLREPPPDLPFAVDYTTPALAMPDEYKSDDPVDSYRLLYVHGKRHLLSYTRREVPYWYDEYLLPTEEG